MAITQKLREIGGIINSTDLNYNFNRMQEDLQLAVEGVIFKDPYTQVETIKDRNSIPEADRVQGMWVAVSENGVVYEYNRKYDTLVTRPFREFGPEKGDLPEIPFRIDGDEGSGPMLNACYVCSVDDRDTYDWKYTSETTGVTYNDGDWAVFIKQDYEQEGHWEYIPKWIPIMDVTSILENNLIGKLEDLHTDDKYRLVNAINEIHDDLGDLDDLTTNVHGRPGTAVAAINELDERCGELPDLKTAAKENLVAAINEVDDNVGPIEDLTTTNKGNVTLAINELHAEHGTLSDLHTEDKNTFVGAINEIHDDLGTIETLTTNDKSTAVAAINEIDVRVGKLPELKTADKTSVINAINGLGDISKLETNTKITAVAAINELDARAGELPNLTTTNKTNLVAAINEVDKDVGNVSTLTTSNKTDVVHAINELDAEIGPLNTLTTADKSTIVKSINEVDKDVGNVSSLTTNAKADTVSAINELKAITDTLRGATIVIGRINLDTADVTQDALTARAKEIMGADTLQTGWTLVDNEQHEWHWNGTNWQDLEQPNIYPAQNGTLGLVRGSATGDVSITDGNMTVLQAANAAKLGNQLPAYYAKSADVGTVGSLTTTNKTVVTAINELDGEIGDLSTLHTEAKDKIVNAINEVHDDLGTINNLTTTVKTDAVAAINELKGRCDTEDINITNLQNTKADKTNVLEKDNTTPYTPSADYHPATKAYVDSLTGGASWGEIVNNIEDQEDLMQLLNDRPTKAQVLTKTNTTAFTPSANYHPATKKYVDDVFATVNGWGQIQGDIADQQDLQNELTKKQDKVTAWNTTNLVVSTTQPAVPTSGYIVWIDLNS